MFNNLFLFLIKLISVVFKSKITLAGEVLILRQQLYVIRRTKPDIRSKLQETDRTIITLGRKLISNWRNACYLVKPATVIKWHKNLIKNHINDIFCCDFFTVGTVLFKRYYVFFIIRHLTRKIYHIDFTEHPKVEWVKQQIKQALCYTHRNIYLIHDRDSKISFINFRELNITPLRISYLAPDMNAYAERFVSSIRRECLDHYIILNERHLKKVITGIKSTIIHTTRIRE